MRILVFEVFLKEPIVPCKAFEDNSRTIELAHLSKICPRIKHINVFFVTYMSTYIRDLYLYIRFLRMTSVLMHGIICFHTMFSQSIAKIFPVSNLWFIFLLIDRLMECDNLQASGFVVFLYILRFSPWHGILFSNQIKLNLSIFYSNQTWDSSLLCLFEYRLGVKSHKSIRLNWFLRLIYYVHSLLQTISFLMEQKVVPSSGNLLRHLNIGHEGVI